MKKLIVMLGLFLVLGLTGAKAQSQDMSGMNMTPPDVSTMNNGDSVPDIHAYLLWFNHVTTDGNAQARQDLLDAPGLSAADTQALSDILTSFKSQHDSLIASYNQSVSAGGTGNPEDLFVNVLKLVTQTRLSIKQSLTHEGVTVLHTFIKNEKKNMYTPGTWRVQ